MKIIIQTTLRPPYKFLIEKIKDMLDQIPVDAIMYLINATYS